MKKIIFSGFCMLTSVFGLITMFIISAYFERSFGSINGNSSIFTYLNYFKITPFFIFFCILGIISLLIGLWGILENENK
jgi:hypothetical protein